MQQTRVETRTYTLADAAAVLGTSEERVLQLVEAGLPERASRLRRPGARALTFQDLVLLRNAKRLVDQAIQPARDPGLDRACLLTTHRSNLPAGFTGTDLPR